MNSVARVKLRGKMLMAIYRHYARKPKREEQSSSNTWRTISAEEEERKK
jgi:hypothetical protein